MSGGLLLQDYLTRTAGERPEATAVVMGEEWLTYAELDEASDRLAWCLVDEGCEPGDRVLLCTDKSPTAVVAMVATLKAGCAYVPIDVDSPPARTARIVASSEPRVVLATPPTTGLLDGLAAEGALGQARVGSLDASPIAGDRVGSSFTRADWERASDEPPAAVRDPDALAHLLFTSGSTGLPKGVMISHRNVTTFVDWAVSHFGTKPGDRISGHPPLHFDLSTFDVYGTLAAGAELHLVPAGAGLDPRALAAFIRDRRLTQWFSVPSVLTYMAKFDAVAQSDFPALERLLWCGEVLPTPVLAHWMDRLPHVRFTNLYGPTEATIASSHHTVDRRPVEETAPIPIGVACDGEELLVLSEDLQPCAAGTPGELYIAGAGLSPGYWRDAEQTSAAFLCDPRAADGAERLYRTGDLARMTGDRVFHFLGRADSQIKSRGYRIELGEVEAAVDAVAATRESAVVGVDAGGFEGTTICCAFVPGDAELTAALLRERLTASLPRYMLPTRWLALDALPKNVNGKIDRRGLRERFQEGADRPAAAQSDGR